MGYPFFSNWISYKRISADKYQIYNHIIEEYDIVDAADFRMARKLNGKRNPRKVFPQMRKSEISELINCLEYEGLIRQKKTIDRNLLNYMRTVKVLCTPRNRFIYWIINLMLMISFLPVFMLGVLMEMGIIDVAIHCTANTNWELFNNSWVIYFVSILVLVFSGAVHEICHAISGRAYGAKVMEFGIVVRIFPAFYTMIDMKTVKSRLKRIQIMAAGLEGQLLLCGAALIVGKILGNADVVNFQFIFINLIMVCVNSLPIEGLDGYKITEIALGNEDIATQSRDLLMNPSLIKKMWNEGLYGKAKIGAALMNTSEKVIYPVLIVVNILSWFGG